MSLWNAGSGTTLATVIERRTISLLLPLANNENLRTEVISGSIPPGMRLSENSIVGTPFEVSQDTVFEFVIRATSNDKLEDRTFKIIVTGPDSPIWQTNEGLLPVGTNLAFYVLDNALVDFQLVATDSDLPSGDTIEYYIFEGEGELPPGLTLDPSGRIKGIVEPLLSLEPLRGDGSYDTYPYAGNLYDFGILSSSGYSSFFYDLQVYDYSDVTRLPKKLNRYYPFTVTATDGDSIVKREFIIYLVGDDYLRADNTIMQVANGVFTADNTYLRNPVWLTPSDLGFRRANNYVTLYFDVIQNETLAGFVYFSLEDFNSDGTLSQLPPGLELDVLNGKIVGQVPYQPAISEEYRFTLKAERFEGDTGIVSVSGNFYEDTLLGNSSFKIYKLREFDADNFDDLNGLLRRTLSLYGRPYVVTQVDNSNENYDIIYLDRTLSPETSLVITKTSTVGKSYIFSQRLGESEKTRYRNRILKFTESEEYQIVDIFPYIEYRFEEKIGMNLYVNPAVIEIKINDQYKIGDYASYNENIYRLDVGDTIDQVVTSTHIVTAETDGQGNIITDNNGNPVPFFDSSKWTLISNDITTISQSINKTILKQKLERLFTQGEAFVENPTIGGIVQNDIWSIKIPSTSKSRNRLVYINNLILNENNTVIIKEHRDNEDFIKLNQPLSRPLELGRNIGIALYQNESFTVNFSVLEEDEVVDKPSTKKEFVIRIIGEIDSTINWITPPDLGSIKANLISTLSVRATTTVPDTKMIYQYVSGKLPNGLSLSLDGQLIGKARQFENDKGLGLTTFDSQSTTWDGNFPVITSFDREFKFVVQARDRFGLSATTREFTIRVDTLDNIQYSNLYVKPFLKPEQRVYYRTFLSNPEIFTPEYIYRPDDSNFGIQNDLKMLIYAGIETKEIAEYVAASAKHHRRKKFKLGKIKNAIARNVGDSEVVYEVIYIEVIDPSDSATGTTRKTLKQKSGKSITTDSISYHVKDDSTNTAVGGAELPVYTREIVKFVIPQNEQLIIATNNGNKYVDADFENFEIEIRNGQSIEISMPISNSEPFRFRPQYENTIKADSNAIKVSQTKDNIKYISNISNMRDQIETIGKKDRLYLPLWMRSSQPDQGLQEIDYTTAIPICYCKPGTSDEILLNIKNSDFDVTNINFDIDRYIIDQTTGNSDEQYIFFANYQFNV